VGGRVSSLPSSVSLERDGGGGDNRRPSDPRTLSLLTLMTTALEHRVSILRWAVVTAAIVSLVSLMTPRSYTVSASFVPQSRRSPSGVSGLAAQLGISVPTEPGQSPAFYADLLKSRPILEAVAESRYALVVDRDSVTGTLANVLKIDDETDVLRRDAAVEELTRAVSVGVTTRTGVVSVDVKTRYADLSVQISRRLLALLNSFNLETRQSQAAAERHFVEARLQDAKQGLRQAEDALQAFLLRNRDFRNAPELSFQQDRLAREVAVQQQVYATLAQAYEQARIEEVRDTPVITVLASPQLPARPDRRGLIKKGFLALLIGGVLGFLVAGWREYVRDARLDEPTTFDRFSLLRRDMREDLRQPWRLVRRLVSPRSTS
jgi:uncharacterized protein involved in exopolysaccharide biosynthesis